MRKRFSPVIEVKRGVHSIENLVIGRWSGLIVSKMVEVEIAFFFFFFGIEYFVLLLLQFEARRVSCRVSGVGYW